MRINLVGGPADGALKDMSTVDATIEAGGAGYVLRELYPLDRDEPNGHVGIFLPLYASLMLRRRGGTR